MSARSHLRPISAAVSVLALLLSLLTAASPASAIEGGDENVAQLPWVAKLSVTEGPGRATLCTGSFISERWILSARHCFDKASQPLSVEVSVTRNGRLEKIGEANLPL